MKGGVAGVVSVVLCPLSSGPLRSGGAGGQDPQGAAHGGAAFSAGAGCPLGKSRRLRGPGATHRARRRGVLSLRQVSLHKQRKVARAVTARKPLILALRSPGRTDQEQPAALAPSSALRADRKSVV